MATRSAFVWFGRAGRPCSWAACFALLLTWSSTLVVADPAAAQPPVSTSDSPLTVERFSLPGPLAGVLTRVDLRDSRVGVEVALAIPNFDADDADCVTKLDTPRSIAQRYDYAVTLNASFFSAPVSPTAGDAKRRYFVGNCGAPSGWHYSAARLVHQPRDKKLRAALVVHADGVVSIHPDLQTLPSNARFAVSGNVPVLVDGRIVATDTNGVRHPRSAVGLSADGKTLFLLVVDGRQEGYSRGANMMELGQLMLQLGAHDAINLDGGGSSAMVLKDPSSGAFALANRPSEIARGLANTSIERPVADVLGIRIKLPVEGASRESSTEAAKSFGNTGAARSQR